MLLVLPLLQSWVVLQWRQQTVQQILAVGYEGWGSGYVAEGFVG